MSEQVGWFVGIDWARNMHRVCLLDAEGKRVGERDVAHEGAALFALCDWLIEKTAAQPGEIAVAIETTHGPIVELMLQRGFAVLRHQPQTTRSFS